MGTTHVCYPECANLPGYVEDVLKQSGVLMLEIREADFKQLDPQILNKYFSEDTKPVPPEIYEKVRKVLGLDEKKLETLKSVPPILFNILVTLEIYAQIGASTQFGIEKLLAPLASKNGIMIESIETPEEQLKLLRYTKLLDGDQIRKMLENSEQSKAEATDLVDNWMDGDEEFFINLLKKYIDSPETRDAMIQMVNERNTRMFDRIIATGHQKAMIAVGMLHMVGPQGLKQLFANAGYSIERVEPDKAISAQDSEYFEFFNKYRSLGNRFDVAITELYSDEAKIVNVRKMPDGIEQTFKIDGKRWKQMIIDSISTAKQLGDRSQFSSVTVKVDGDKARISASRYAVSKCYQDDSYYMIVIKGGDGKLQIMEERTESIPHSNCEGKTKTNLALTLQNSTAIINKQLPLMVDEETRLDRTSSEGTLLIYHYVLVNYSSTDLDTEAFEEGLNSLVTQRACLDQSTRQILDQGGSLSYRYNANDNIQVLVIDVDKSSCEQNK